MLAETLHIEYVLVSVLFIGDPREVSLQAMKASVQLFSPCFPIRSDSHIPLPEPRYDVASSICIIGIMSACQNLAQ